MVYQSFYKFMTKSGVIPVGCRTAEKYHAVLMSVADGVFMVYTGASPKTIQHVRTQTGETACLYYQSRQEVHSIFSWLYEGAELFFPKQKQSFDEVLEEVGYV